MGIRDFFRGDERKLNSEAIVELSESSQMLATSDDSAPFSSEVSKSSKATDTEAQEDSTPPPASSSSERSAKPAPVVDEKVVDEQDEQSDDDSAASKQAKAGRQRLPGYTNAQELLTAEIPARVGYVDAKLRSNLVGSIVINLRDSGEKFLFDWTTEELKTGPAAANGTSDCAIHLSGASLLKIASGELNPQIAMLSDKVKVEGRVGLAIYFFNLVAPRSQN